MEFDISSPSSGINFGNTNTVDTQYPSSLLVPTGGGTWQSGVYFRYRMVPVQYMFSWGSLPGEGPYTTFGGPTAPDSLPVIPIGANYANGEIIGRPLANQYTGFGGADRTNAQGNFAPPFPYYTDTAGRSGQYSYYFAATTDFRPVDRPSFPTNGNFTTYPSDLYGADMGAYNFVIDSDNGLNPGNSATPYLHPMVTPILSDGGWTDDLPENGYANAVGNNAHRSRPTTKTKVRFEVRVTKADNSPLPAQAVQVNIDGTNYTMQPLQIPGNNDYIQGIVFYYDTTFPVGKEGQHYTYFIFDDGNHRAIWPRRDTPSNGTGDGRYFDVQASLSPYANTFGTTVQFGTGVVGKNYLAEPQVNHRPVLSNSSVNPPSGSIGQQFTYTVTYQDADNDAPLQANVVIDGVAHRMTEDPRDAGNTYAQGRRYNYVLTLHQTPDSKHTYYFQFQDNWNSLAAYNVSSFRREAGEFITIPAGDDNGNPSSEISGPIITSNHVVELTEAAFFGSDQAHTPATQYDFSIKVKDADNTTPTSVKLYLSSDNGNTWDSGNVMVPAENNTNYVTGVLYHLSARVKLPVLAGGGAYRYRVEATDGVQVNNTIYTHVGTKDTAISDGTAHQLRLVAGLPQTYADPNSTGVVNSTKDWLDELNPLPASGLIAAPRGTQTYIWSYNGTTYTRLNYGVDYTVDYQNGLLTLTNSTTNKIYASYFYFDTIGPTITPNHPPVLSYPTPGTPTTNDGTLTPLQGAPNTSFTFTVLYADADNQAPTFGSGTTGVNVVIDTNTTVQMTLDPKTPTPVDYTKGVKFIGTTTLGVGKHFYHFEASDGQDTARLPDAAATPAEITGPTVTDSTNLVNPLVNPLPKGKSTDNYTFTVTYKNPNGNAPPQGGIEVRLVQPGATSGINLPLNPIDPISPTAFQNGVRYQGQLSATTNPPLTAGTYNVVFGFASNQASGTAPIVLIVNGQPTLSSPGATPNPQSAAGDVTFGVTYSDPNGDLPVRNGVSTIQLLIDGVPFTSVKPTTAGTDYKQGVLYSWKVPANTLVDATHPVGTVRTYQFTAKDDLEDAVVPFVPVTPGNFVINAAQVPVLSEPGGDATNNNGTLTPLTGSATASFTYSVIYSHADGVAPAAINVVIDGGTANAKTVALTATKTNPTSSDFVSGLAYSTTVNNLAGGVHTYKFTASDRLTGTAGHDVTLPTVTNTTYSGPTVNNVPGLSAGTVYTVGMTTPPAVDATTYKLTPALNGNVLSKFVFQVTYKDKDGVAPSGSGFVKVKINNSQDIIMSPKAGDPLNYAAGVVYTTDPAGTVLTSGQKAFHFEANDGTDPGRFPTVTNTDITGLTVANIPVLSKVVLTGDDGTLSPRTGPLSTSFTYKVVYSNADNTPPAYVKVTIDGTSYAMQPVAGSGTNYAAGVTYQYVYRFAGGNNHTYKFTAQDTVSPGYVAQYPADGSAISGPAINVPVFLQPTFVPNPGIIGQPVTFTSQLITNVPLGTSIAIQLVRPDGSGVNDSAQTSPADGTFQYTFTPTQTGSWKIRLSYGGSTGIYDPLTTEFPYTVNGFKLTSTPLAWDFISLPLVPVTPDPSVTFGVTAAGTNNPVAVTALNVNRWVPDGTGAGRYFALNTDLDFPALAGGQGFWVYPGSPVDVNPRGRLWDQTQPYTITLGKGWNMIGSVFTSDINWSAVKAISGGTTFNITDAASPVRPIAWGYNPLTNAYEAVSAPSGVLRSGRGYWVKALAPVQLTLNPPGTKSVIVTKDVLSKENSLQVAVRSGNSVEDQNYIPVAGMDATRIALMEKPPYIKNYVSVHYVSANSVQLPAASRSVAANANVSAFEVLTDKVNSDVVLQFPNAATLGRKNNITVIDLTSGQSRSIGTTSAITYNTGDNKVTRKFAVIMQPVTASDRLVISDLRTTSGTKSTGSLTFGYNISSQATVKAQIVGLAGNVVRDLDGGRSVTRGVNNLSWDGKDTRGISVPAGSYLLKLTATDDKNNAATQTLQVILVR